MMDVEELAAAVHALRACEHAWRLASKQDLAANRWSLRGGVRNALDQSTHSVVSQ